MAGLRAYDQEKKSWREHLELVEISHLCSTAIRILQEVIRQGIDVQSTDRSDDKKKIESQLERLREASNLFSSLRKKGIIADSGQQKLAVFNRDFDTIQADAAMRKRKEAVVAECVVDINLLQLHVEIPVRWSPLLKFINEFIFQLAQHQAMLDLIGNPDQKIKTRNEKLATIQQALQNANNQLVIFNQFPMVFQVYGGSVTKLSHDLSVLTKKGWNNVLGGYFRKSDVSIASEEQQVQLSARTARSNLVQLLANKGEFIDKPIKKLIESLQPKEESLQSNETS